MRFKKVLRLIFHFIAFLFLEPIYLFKKFKIGHTKDEWIGHQVLSAAAHLSRMKSKDPKGHTMYFIISNGKFANSFMNELIDREIVIIKSFPLSWLWNKVVKHFLVKTKYFYNFDELNYNMDFAQIMKQQDKCFKLTEKDHEKGRLELRRMGIDSGAWYVCFHARDAAHKIVTLGKGHKNIKTSEVRNCSIENFEKAMKYILDLGGHVIRMGSHVENQFEIDHPRYIDYASRYRSDFLDIYLPATSRLFVGCNSGLLTVPMVFGVPVAATNFLPLIHIPNCKTILWPKLYRIVGQDKVFSFKEIKELGLNGEEDGIKLAELNIEVVENSSDDILDLCKEIIGCIESDLFVENEDQIKFKEQYMVPQNDIVVPNCSGAISKRFLKRYSFLL